MVRGIVILLKKRIVHLDKRLGPELPPPIAISSAKFQDVGNRECLKHPKAAAW